MDQIPSEAYRVQVHHKADPFNELSEATENYQYSVKEIQLFCKLHIEFDEYIWKTPFLVMSMKELVI